MVHKLSFAKHPGKQGIKESFAWRADGREPHRAPQRKHGVETIKFGIVLICGGLAIFRRRRLWKTVSLQLMNGATSLSIHPALSVLWPPPRNEGLDSHLIALVLGTFH